MLIKEKRAKQLEKDIWHACVTQVWKSTSCEYKDRASRVVMTSLQFYLFILYLHLQTLTVSLASSFLLIYSVREHPMLTATRVTPGIPASFT